ncbi:hypothetical protein [Streptomyces sp. NPDC127033]
MKGHGHSVAAYSSLRENDEALLRLEGAAPYDAYLRDFAALQAAAAKV